MKIIIHAKAREFAALISEMQVQQQEVISESIIAGLNPNIQQAQVAAQTAKGMGEYPKTGLASAGKVIF